MTQEKRSFGDTCPPFMVNHEIRIRQLETRQDRAERDISEIANDIKSQLKTLNEKLDSQATATSRDKGFLGGVIFILSCIWVFFVCFKDNILSHFK